MKILTYAGSYTRYMLIYFPYNKILFHYVWTNPIMLPYITKLYKHGEVITQHVTVTSSFYHTRYHMHHRTFQPSLTWIGHYPTSYHNFNALLHPLPYIFSQFSLVWGLFTTGCHQIYIKKNSINICTEKKWW